MSRWLLVSLLLTLAAAAAGLYVFYGMFEQLPAEVPTHWNIADQPDAWTPREKMLPIFLLMPGIMVLMLALTVVLPWISPKNFEIEGFRSTWDYVMALVIGMFTWMQFAMLYASIQPGVGVGRLFLAGIFLFFALMGNVMGRVRRNFWMGIRTPWTLASEQVWYRTHRLAAWLFVGVGILGFLGVLVGISPLWTFGGLMGAALIPVCYSLYLYKRLQRAGQLDSPT